MANNMKAILYMTMTVNGCIARSNDDTPWSDEVWSAYYEFVKQRGNIVVGRRTYELMKAEDEFEKLGNSTIVVVSSEPVADSNIFWADSPKKALEFLGTKGFGEAVIGGGATLNASFLKAGLLDEICLDVEPLLFGQGIRLFKEVDAEAKLKFLGTEKLSDQVLRVRYKVIK